MSGLFYFVFFLSMIAIVDAALFSAYFNNSSFSYPNGIIMSLCYLSSSYPHLIKLGHKSDTEIVKP